VVFPFAGRPVAALALSRLPQVCLRRPTPHPGQPCQVAAPGLHSARHSQRPPQLRRQRHPRQTLWPPASLHSSVRTWPP